jgi:hypothetical protein
MPPPRIPRKDAEPKVVAWASLPILISAIAVFFTAWITLVTMYVFTLSCAYVASLDIVLRFSFGDFLDYSDYVQCLPERQTYASVISAILLVPLLVLGWKSSFSLRVCFQNGGKLRGGLHRD